MRRLWIALLLGMSAFGCATTGGAGPTSAAPAQTMPPPPEESGRAQAYFSGADQQPPVSPPSSQEDPLRACGALESYHLVAGYRCRDGSVPLRGDPQLGSDARLGSSSSHQPSAPGDFLSSHIVDVYEVPCPGGPEQVFVCLYHCPVGGSPRG